MDQLSLFKAAVVAWLQLSDLASLALKHSGSAEVIDLAGTKTYSTSLIPPIDTPFPANSTCFHKIAQRNPLPGYKLIKTQILRFEADIPLPEPRWRYQVIFTPPQ